MTACKITSLSRTAAFFACLGAALMAGGLIAAAPPANAGCLYGGPVLSKCDGPVQPDGTWQRCVAFTTLVPSGMSTFLMPEKRCDVMGPDQHPADAGFADPPAHIDD
ncbi:hypothetical protein A5791_19950 [Mycobacterium sp. 852002-51163_SCH5372311]|uniref:CDGP domain-containing protein n=1 Tax=Mycobacterium sp. 852002-51163_SCH5372311 TaxID=1834097 RepID=UPI0007FCE5BD|nr:hypothetical protein A5791_19950 [Mycobacterium sp. 852002-51163_SCH5372311]